MTDPASHATRRDVLALASGLAGIGALWFKAMGPTNPGSNPSPETAMTERTATVPSTQTPAQPAPPMRLGIPAISLDSAVVAGGTAANGQIVPPAGKVQWYDSSPVPGTPGTAVMAGHVTSPEPDVFHRLPEVRPGDAVKVTSEQGVTTTFRVTHTARQSKKELTTDATTWGPTHHRALALITWDKDSAVEGRHYTGNFVAWARAST